ncbi:hypothetical protein CBER1_07535 [Cercospora berteroae]|uniref:Nascent polypeptide-associated complex subunit beta n=1 Tax=Cercospora berteroae TaxID=357750 RepID=A0A2S6BUB7_9PEZI|nr:hypothetical protein CBER1_07535 [Cercospora berteroae]
MPIIATPANDEDIPRLFEIACSAFARNEHVWDIMWPEHWTPEGRAAGAARMLETKRTTPSTTYLKAVDTETNEIVGMAKWNLWENHKVVSSDPKKEWYFNDEKEWRYAKGIMESFLEERNKAIEERNGTLVSLDILTVDPKWQRKGVGEVLVKWGIEEADKRGVEAIVESSVFGRRLYEKNGGKGTPRRKVKKVNRTGGGDDKKLQAALKKMNVQPIPAIEEVNMFKQDGNVIHFSAPKVHASVPSNTFAIYGNGEDKELTELVPGILNQLGPDSLASLRKLAESYQSMQKSAEGEDKKDDDDDEIPDLVEGENFESKNDVE